MSEYKAAWNLERFLGDPRDPASRISFRAQVEADEREEPPWPAIQTLHEWGYPEYLVPEWAGGKMRSMGETLWLSRVLARRDLVLAIAYGATLLGAAPVWSLGDEQQCGRVAELIMGGGFGAFALSEREHGSDLLATEVIAEPTEDGYLVSGTKWPIGNATRSRFATVFARTGHGPRGFSMFLLDKDDSAVVGWLNERRVPTMGMRGADLSGFTFHQCIFPSRARVGGEGLALEQALKTLQVARTLTTSLSLGAADTALRVALRHACDRQLYRSSVYSIPVIRDQLIAAYLDILIAECVTTSTARAVSMAPQRLSLWSAITKYLVPVLTDEIISNTRAVLSARHFMRDDVGDGIFQKLLRDHAIVSVFEGTTHVNLHSVARELPALLLQRAQQAAEDLPAAGLFSRTQEAPTWNPRDSKLQLTNGGKDEMSQSWSKTAGVVAGICAHPTAGLNASVASELAGVVSRLTMLWDRQWSDVQTVIGEDGDLRSGVRGFELARRHCLLHAAACCVHTWLANRSQTNEGDAFVQGGEWLLLCLHRVADRLEPALRGTSPHVAVVEQQMMDCLTEDRLFSLTPFDLGRAESSRTP